MTVDYDNVLEDIGQLGPWQRKLFALLCIPSAMSAMAVFMYDFTAYVPQHRCFVSQCDGVSAGSLYDDSFVNFTIPWDEDLETYGRCKMYTVNASDSKCEKESFVPDPLTSCASWVFDHQLLKSSAVEDYEMVCKHEWRKSLTQTMYMVGMLIGSFIFGWMSDVGGRKSTMMVGLVILTIGGCLPYFIAPKLSNYYVLVIARFISGMGHVGTFMMSFNLALEYVGPKYRTMFGILIETPFAMGGLVVGLVSYAGVRDWQLLTLVLSAPNLLLLSYWVLLPESPRWLIAKNKTEQLMIVLQNAADTNKKVLPTLQEDTSIKNSTSSSSMLDLFRPAVILVRSSTMFFNWMVTTMCYYGLTSAAATLTPDLYINFLLAIFVEIPAHFALLLVLDRLGRKPVLGLSQILAGVTCIGAGLITRDSLRWLQISLALVGKFGATASFAVVFVYTAEMFPTEIRSSAVGASSLCGRVGGIIAPQIAGLSSVWPPLPLIIMGSGALVGGVLVFMFLPETLGKRLPDTMQEALNLGNKSSYNV